MTAGAAVRPRPNRQSESRQEALAGYALIGLPMVLFLVLNIGSIVYAFFISFWEWGARGPREFLGVGNYSDLLDDGVFLKGILNTVYYTAVWVPISMAIGLFLAVIVNAKIRGQTFFRAAFYFPAIASSAAITVLWIFLFAPNGLFNGIREVFPFPGIFALMGLPDNQNWIGHSSTAMNSIIALNAWTTSATFMLFYLASLQTISHEIYEAAAIDGAGAWDTFWRITFPLLKPGHYFVATVAVIGGLQLFDQAFIAGGVGGEPNNALTTIVLYLYREAIREFNFGYAAAVGMVLFVIVFTATLIQRRLFGQAPSW
jgi:ABC-type sugar transport system permease subunit